MEKELILADFRRYADLLTGAITSAPASVPLDDLDLATAVECGTIFPDALIKSAPPSPAVLATVKAGSPRLDFPILDSDGASRPVYRGLLTYARLQAFGLLYEKLPAHEFGRWEETLRAWADRIESDLMDSRWPAELRASAGTVVSKSVWYALALQVAGKIFVRDAWTDIAAETFGRLAKHQTTDGNFLATSPSDNLETHGYDELVILHAAASYAVQAEDRALAAAVTRATEFHQSQTQPDHSTSQPWAVFAFLWNAKTRPLADQIIHAAKISHPATFDGLSWMLLADALYCLKLFLPKESTR